MNRDRLVWGRKGDCTAEAQRFLDQNLRENGRLTGNPSTAVRTGNGRQYTILVAEGDWWVEHMRLHGTGWSGPVGSDEDFLDMLGLDSDA